MRALKRVINAGGIHLPVGSVSEGAHTFYTTLAVAVGALTSVSGSPTLHHVLHHSIAGSSPWFDSLAYISLSKFPAPTAAAPKRLNPATTNDEAARCTDRSMLSGRPNTDGCKKA